jgi:formiminotetrahydrofolate cyclodeaminase
MTDDARTLGELLAEVAAPTPAPAGGCATAWVGALASALAQMTAGFAEDGEAVARAATLRDELLAAADADRGAYAPVLEAIRLPREDPDRARRIDVALAAAADPPLRVAEAAAEVAALCAGVLPALRPAVREDAITGAILAETVVRCAARLVRANLSGQGAESERARLAQASERAAQAVRTALAQAPDS